MNADTSIYQYLAVDDDGAPFIVKPSKASSSESAQYDVIGTDDEPNGSLVAVCGHLIIRNPFILSPNDPYLDLELFSEKFGHEKACEIAMECRHEIERTKNWKMLSEQYFVDSAEALLKLDKRNVDMLYTNFDPIVNSKNIQVLLKESGFDGLIYQSNTESASRVVCVVFDDYQFVPFSDIHNSISPECMLRFKVDEIKRHIIQSARSGGVSVDSLFIQSVHRQMLPVDIFDSISENDSLVSEVGKQYSWEKVDYAEFSNGALRELNNWIGNGGLKNNTYVLNNIKDRRFDQSKFIKANDFSTDYEIG